MRGRVHDLRHKFPLFDIERFTRDLEALFVQLHNDGDDDLD